jgi:hypothetical protein
MKNNTLSQSNRFHKKLYGLIILVFISLVGFSQNVGINATGAQPNPTAGLDVDFMNMGLLIPRVALTGTANAAPLAAKVAGMIIYNTATVSDVKPGFYYNDGTNWIAGFPVGSSIGDMLYWNGTAWVKIPTGISGQYLQLSATNVPTWGGAASSSISTVGLTAITGITAASGGNIASDGGSPVLARGVCWNTATSPTIANSKTTDGSGIGVYASNLTGLLPGTVYYVKAYSMNSYIITYGNELTFTTLAIAPTLAATTAATLVTGTTALTGGSITSTGGATITEKGICYSTTVTSPTILDTKLVDVTTGLLITSPMTGLLPNTTYYVRSYATNSAGLTGYGSLAVFITRPVITTTAATSITGGSAVAGGVLTAGQGSWYYGIAYSTTSNAATPTLAQAATFPNTSPIPFSVTLIGLVSNTTYYIRGYVIGSGYTVYGPELSFTTAAPSVPVVASTNAVTNIMSGTATSGGTITSDGGSVITHKGVVWGTTTTPVIGAANFTDDIATYPGLTAFVSNLTGLTGSTTYYARAYATNAIGTSYGPVTASFTTWVQSQYTVGQVLSYGVVGYVAPDGSGFVVSPDIYPTSPATNFSWGCSGTHVAGVGTALGTGKTNTNLIIAACGGTTAASTAKAYTGGGFTDWYLPSNGEWAAFAPAYYYFGLGTNVSYYTSSEYDLAYVSAGSYFSNSAQAYASGSPRVGDAYTTAIKAIRNFAAPSVSVPVVATVITAPVIDITATTATGGGNITSDVNFPVTISGICWNTITGPTISNSHTTDGNIGSFSTAGNITGLTSGTTYYVRAYATQAGGTVYGNEVTFIATDLPTVSTLQITNIAGTSASSGGNVSIGATDPLTGLAVNPITAHGVCWSTSALPTIANSLTVDGTGSGLFYSNITGLTSGTLYHLRAYATNGSGTAYGSELTFTPTGPALPTVTTTAVTSPTATSGITGGNVTNIGSSSVTARGVCWSINPNPTVTDSKTTNSSGPGIFASTVTGLISGTTYYIRAYATNGAGTAYGNEITYFPLGLPIVETLPATLITGTSAQSGGSIISDGGSAVAGVSSIMSYGVCWNQTGSPTIASHTGITNDYFLGIFAYTSTIASLTSGTTYHVRAYATNNLGTSYGNEIVFTAGTLAAPTVTTTSLINKVGSFAVGGGGIISDNGSPITAYGICWGTALNPDIVTNAATTTTDNLNPNGIGNGTYASTITGLTIGTTYHVRAYAMNITGTAYGSDVSFVATAPILGQFVSYPNYANFYNLNTGFVIYVDGTGKGLIADQYYYGTTADWGNPFTLVGASGTAVGTGLANTTAIVTDNAIAGWPSLMYGFAADISKNNGPEWYLPSKAEFDLLWANRGVDANLNYMLSNAMKTTPFWSSSEADAGKAWYFNGTTWISGAKTTLNYFWFMRSF